MNKLLKNKKWSRLMALSLMGSILVGCSANEQIVQEYNEQEQNKQVVQTQNETTNPEVIMEIDYSKYFNGINGCAVFFDAQKGMSEIHNVELAQVVASPCSTFKIVSTLIGLKAGVLKDIETKMGYEEGVVYPMEVWNKDLSLKEAFQNSCVWYYRKMINQVGKEKVDEILKAIAYGNCDTTEWEGNSINEQDELNGFWLESSLEISPYQQVHVLANIFEENSIFTEEERSILKEIMLVEENENYKVYGKTGTGYSDNAWFVGLIENDKGNEYFAIRLNAINEGKEKSDTVSGGTAKEIALRIIAERF